MLFTISFQFKFSSGVQFSLAIDSKLRLHRIDAVPILNIPTHKAVFESRQDTLHFKISATKNSSVWKHPGIQMV